MTVLAVAPVTDVSYWLRANGLPVVLYVLGAVLLGRGISWSGDRITARIDVGATGPDELVRSEASKHRHAVAQVLTWAAIVLVYCLAAGMVVELLGIPVTGLVAPATVAGVALGFGAQRVVQDVLAGFFLITERQYGFGDVLRISVLGSTEVAAGTVEEVTLRVTRLRASNGEVVMVPNGQIVQVVNLSRDWARAVVDVPVAVSVDVARISELLRRAGTEAFADPQMRPLLLDEPTVMGVESLGVQELTVRMVARTLPGRQFDVGRMLRARVAATLRDAGIHLPARVDAGAPTGQS